MPPDKSRARIKTPSENRTLDAGLWRISHAKGLQIIKARPFEAYSWLLHGFSSRSGGESALKSSHARHGRSEKVLNVGFMDWDSRERIETNRARFVEALGARSFSLVPVRQFHSDVVLTVDRSAEEPFCADALVSRSSGLLLAIQTADCIPILLLDPPHRAVAAVHAGWRGTLTRIAGKAVGRMQMEFGSNPENLLAALGPGIHQCCYEVGPDIVAEFAAQFSEARGWFAGPFDAMSSGEDTNPLPWLSMMPPGHKPAPPCCTLDLYAANAAILADAGLNPKSIFCSDFCTSCRTDLFFSYRREGRTGRMMAVIGIK